MSFLKEKFYSLVGRYSGDISVANKLWNEIKDCYSQAERRYHTLTHLEHFFLELEHIQEKIRQWDTILFALFYHDIVYDAPKQDNEEKSAELAVQRLESIGFPEEGIEQCKALIIATKSHQAHSDSAGNFFTDADLSILGKDRKSYQHYAEQIRQEYSLFPDHLYSIGRAKFIEHFLSMPSIFKTDFFQTKYAEQAIANLKWELSTLAVPNTNL